MASEPALDSFGLSGKVIAGRFRVDAAMGQGGFGTVYRGVHLNLQSPVAIKCLRIPDELTEEKRKEFVARFLNEGRLMHELSRADAGIAQAIEVDVLQLPDGRLVPFMVLEWIDGRSLDTVLQEALASHARMPIDQVIIKLDSIARALGVAHAMGIAHRDIKPSNIMLTDTLGRTNAKLLDFGIAKIMQGVGGQMTTRGQGESSGAFTPMYAAPEQWVARFGGTGPWTDVFSFALVCVEMLCGVSALPGSDPSQWIGACLDPTQRPTPRARGVELGEGLEAVFQKALALDTKSRYQSVPGFWSDLKRASRFTTTSEAPAPGPTPGTIAAGPELASVVSNFYAPRASMPSGTVLAPPTGGGYGGPPSLGLAPGGASAPLVPAPPAAGAARAKKTPIEWLRGLSPAALGGSIVALCAIVAFIVFLVARSSGSDEDDVGPMAISSATPTATELAPTGPAPTPTAAAADSTTLSVFCIPGCDSLSVDRDVVGPSPMLRKPTAGGPHTLRAARAGTQPREVSIVVSPGRDNAVRLWMNP